MATGVNVKMGVSGVAQFKQGMKESQAAVKNLDQQLKLNEQQLKTTGDAELYLQNKTKLLQEQIEKQSQIVQQSEKALAAMRKNGVAETSAAFQNMQAQMYKATTDLWNMRAQLDGVGQAGDDAASGVDEMNNQLKHIGQGVSFQNVTDGLGKITDGMETAAKKALDLGKKIVNATIDAGSWADDLATRAAYYEMTPEQLQRAQKTARLIDTNVEAIVGAQRKLKKGIGSADKGVMGAFAELFGDGYDPRQKGWESAFWDAGEAIMKFFDAEEKEVYAQRLFGRSWSELIPLFTEGREQYEKMNASWNVVSDDNLKKLTDFDDQYQKMISEFETLKMTLLSSFAEGLTPAFEALTNLMGKFNEYLSSPEGQEMLDKLGESVKTLFDELSNVEPEEVMGTLRDLLNGVTEGFKWLIDNKDSVFTALKVIAGGFALLKITELAANIGKTVGALKNLMPSGAPATTPETQTVLPSAGTGKTGGTDMKGWFSNLMNNMVTGASVNFAFNMLDEQKKWFEGALEEVKQLTAQNNWSEEDKNYYMFTGKKPDINDKDYQDWVDIVVNGKKNENQERQEEKGFDLEALKQGQLLTQEFAQKWLDWFNDPEAENDQYLELWSKLNDENILDDFNDSMQDVLNGTNHYSDEEINAFYAPIMRALELIEQDTDAQSKQNTVTSDDIAALKSLPAETGNAVARSMSNITIIIDDRGVNALGERISRNQGTSLLGQIGR